MQLLQDFQHPDVRRAACATTGQDQSDARAMRPAGSGADLHAGVGVRSSLCMGDDGRREPLQCEK
ncbi:MAG: hypothetical protein PVSMB6_02700 [Steroidobacteraceae bacterium]